MAPACASRKFCAAHGGSCSSKETATAGLRALLQSGETNPPMRTCSRALFRQVFQTARTSRKLVTTNPKFVFRLLSPVENTSFLGERLTGATSDSGATNGVRRGGAAGSRKSLPKIASRSRSRKRGSWAKGNASCLLCGPLRGRMSGHIEMQDEASVMGQHQKHVKYFEADRRHREEVD